ncbi:MULTISPECIES: hypothetical protein [Clostridium]|nr:MULTISPECIES: hypothetical protein [Clostridium]
MKRVRIEILKFMSSLVKDFNDPFFTTYSGVVYNFKKLFVSTR